jgi:uncharacterized protein (DUF1800 family)
MTSRLLLAPLLLLLCSAAGAQSLFSDSFEPMFDRPDDAEAARFLNTASFGATRQEINRIRATGVYSWIHRQFALPPTLARPFMESLAVSENLAGRSIGQTQRVQRWVDTAVTAPDQLRQRVAFALGQLIVVSDRADSLSGEAIMMAEWNDLLVRNAFGNYRTLLGQASRSPMMANYLTYLRNRKFELTPQCARNTVGTPVSCTSSSAAQPPVIVAYQLPSGGARVPDENYARELMQLFTIGLIERNLDFSPILVDGQPVSTYTQEMIVTLARVLTGFAYSCSGDRQVQGRTISRTCAVNPTSFPGTPGRLVINGRSDLVHPDLYEPMTCVPRFHDTGRDRVGFQLPGMEASAPVGAQIQLGAGETIPGGTPAASKPLELAGSVMLTLAEVSPGLARTDALNCDSGTLTTAQYAQCRQYCDNSLDAALDLLFAEPNTAVMVSRHLIQRLVSSNPSPQYIERVAQVFVDNGAGVRGDLKAVVYAVLQDVEARRPLAQGGFAIGSGRTVEPLLKPLQLWRSIGAVSGDTDANGYRRWARTTGPCSPGNWPQCAYQQRPLGAESVFNFFEPDYAQPGAISDLDLVSPEFQIINENTTMLVANDLYAQICSGWGSSNNCHGALVSPVPGDRAHFPAQALDALPGGNCGTSCSAAQDAALIGELDILLLGGSMSGAIGNLADPGAAANHGMRGTLFRLLREGISGSMGQAEAQDARRREILYLLHLIAVSPEFNTRR